MSPSTSAPLSGDVRRILLVTCLASFLAPFMSASLNLAVPAIGAELRVPAVVLNWVVGAYLVASAALLLPFGRLGDIHGWRRVFLAGSVVHTIFSACAAFAASGSALVVWRILQGVGGAMVFATGVAILTAAVPAQQRGRVLGINTAAVYTGLSLGPVAGGLLVKYAGWRSIFVVNAALGLFVAILAAVVLRQEWRGDGERFDAVGALLYGVPVSALLAGIAALKVHHSAWVLAVVGALGVAAFVVRELSTSRPLLDLALFRSVAFALSNLAALIHYCATFASSFLLSLYLLSIRGLDPRLAGLVLLVQPVLMTVLSPLAGRLSDRLEPRFVSSVGMGLTFAGLLALATLGVETPLVVVAVGLGLGGVGFALFSSPNTNAVMSSAPRGQYGVAAATLGTMRVVGQAASLALVSLIIATFMGSAEVNGESSPQLLRSMRVAFLLFATLCATGIPASLARGRIRARVPVPGME